MSFIRKFLTPVAEEPILEKKSAVCCKSDNLLLLNTVQNEKREPISPSYENEAIIKSVEQYTTEDFVDLITSILAQKEASVPTEKAPETETKAEPENLPVTETEKEPFSIKSYFADKGIELTFYNGKEPVAAIESLAFTIAINYPRTKPFIRFLRDCIVRKSFDFTYALTSFSPADKSAIVSLAEKLDEYGLIAYRNKGIISSSIKGTVSTCPKCINFINGTFLELYAKSVTTGVIKKAAAAYGLDYEIHNNVMIKKDDEEHELDIVFRIGRHVFWEEVKSANLDADKYRKIGILMGVIPDRLILLAAEKTNEAAAGISDLYDYYCANINTFKHSLTEMTEKALKEDK